MHDFKKKIIIQNPTDLHTRPANDFVALATQRA
ncbi:MAG: HPr family phosphocarrier protein [Treponema sp.]